MTAYILTQLCQENKQEIEAACQMFGVNTEPYV